MNLVTINRWLLHTSKEQPTLWWGQAWRSDWQWWSPRRRRAWSRRWRGPSRWEAPLAGKPSECYLEFFDPSPEIMICDYYLVTIFTIFENSPRKLLHHFHFLLCLSPPCLCCGWNIAPSVNVNDIKVTLSFTKMEMAMALAMLFSI